MLTQEDDKIIANLFKKEAGHFVKDEDFLMKLHQKYCPTIKWYSICWKRKYCPEMITDGVGILKGHGYIGLCHCYSYSIQHLSTELFAEVLEAEVFGYQIPLTIYKGECPQTYSYIKNKIYEVLNP